MSRLSNIRTYLVKNRLNIKFNKNINIIFHIYFPSTLYNVNFLVPDTEPLASCDRWDAPEKSYPPRSRRDAKEGLRFGKSASFPYYYPPRKRYPRERRRDLPLRGYPSRATRTTNADAGISEREERERGSDL